MKKVFIVDGFANSYANLFRSIGFEITQDPLEADIACFTGGEDVDPAFYQHHRHPSTHSNIWRDQEEAHMFEMFLQKGTPMVGICRGGQFLNVMSGGEMYQDVTDHTRSHEITDATTGEVVYVSSTHHQMMKPSSKAVLVAFSTLGGQRLWAEGEIFKMERSEMDYEVVFYEETDCLCFQPHPEFMSAEYEGMRSYFKSLLSRFFNL